MDPVSLVVSAVVLGAAAGVQDTVAQVVKDAYAGVKLLLGRRGVDVTGLERRPESAAQRAALQETLTDLGAGEDDELLAAARELVAAVKTHAQAVAPAVGIDLDRVDAEFLRVQQVRSDGTGVRVTHSRFSGGIDIGAVDAGQRRAEGMGERP